MSRSRSQSRSRASRVIVVLALVSLSLSVPAAPAAGASSGVFRLGCDFSHRAKADPIMSPGVTSAHLHDFFGNESTDQDSTYDSMVGQPTSCEIATDTAAFWAPTMLDKNEDPIPVDGATVYYRDWPDGANGVTAFPKDFRMISGFPNLQQDKGISSGSAVGGNWGFACDNEDPLQPTSAIDCTGKSQTDVMAVVFFPQCGERDANGKIVTDSSDHRSHAAFATSDGGCPADHPVKLPLAYLKIKYAVTDCIQAQCHLSSDMDTIGGETCSDPGCTLHADFWNTWEQGPPTTENTLKNLVKTCLNAVPEKECKL